MSRSSGAKHWGQGWISRCRYPRPRATINLLSGRSLQAGFCSCLVFHTESVTSLRTTSAALLSSPCPNTSVKDLLSLSLSLSSSFSVPCSAARQCVYFSKRGIGAHFAGSQIRNPAVGDLCRNHRCPQVVVLTTPPHRCPHCPTRLLGALQSSPRGSGFQFTEGFPYHLRTFSFRL